MPRVASLRSHKPRELRTKVMLAARLRADAGWGDACILNVSSRGLLITSSRVGGEGSTVELRHGPHAIVARVVWRKGTRAGLRAESGVPVEEIVTMSRAAGLQLTARDWCGAERRQTVRARSAEQSRFKARLLEFASVVIIGVSLAASAFSMVQQAFARPLAMVTAALGG